LTDSQLGGGRMKFPGASSQLVIDAVKPLFIIEMKKVHE
jgi:hypothetical protein